MTENNTLPARVAIEEGDDSEVFRLREEVRRLTAGLEEMRDHLPEAFIEIDLSTFKLLYMNRVAQALLGYEPEDVAAGIPGFALIDGPSQLQTVEIATGQLADTLWAGKPYVREHGQRTFQMTMVRKDGGQFPADIQGSYMLDEQQRPIGVRFMFRDTTERQLAEAERARLAAPNGCTATRPRR